MTLRSTNSLLLVFLLAVFAVVVIPGCGKANPPQASSSTNPNMFDFGRISVDTGVQKLRHEFVVRNDSDSAFDILAVKRSCGCVAASVANDHLEPGEATTLELFLEMHDAGIKSESATVVLSNEQLLNYQVTAFGTLSLEIVPILRTAHIDPDTHQIDVRLYLIDTDGRGETDPPTIVGPDNVSIAFHDWITIEEQTSRKLRPTRQIANTVLDFSKYIGDYPVTVEIRSAIGAPGSVVVYGPAS